MKNALSYLGKLAVDLFVWWDFPLGVAVGVAVFFLARANNGLHGNAVLILVTESLVAVALLAVALTALAILVGFLSEDYLHLLRRTKGGVPGVLRPYKVVGSLGAVATILTLAGALVSGAARTVTQQALTLAIPNGFLAWAVGSTLDLIFQTAKHGRRRARLPEIREEGVRALEERRNRPQAGP